MAALSESVSIGLPAGAVLRDDEGLDAGRTERWTAYIDLKLPAPESTPVFRFLPQTYAYVVSRLSKFGHDPVVSVTGTSVRIIFGTDSSDHDSAYRAALRALSTVAEVLPLPVVAITIRSTEETEAAIAAMPDVLGVAEAAAVLGVTPQRVGQLVADGKLAGPIARVRATPLWLADDVRTLAAKRKVRTLPRGGTRQPKVRLDEDRRQHAI
jgi:hypothetical protein